MLRMVLLRLPQMVIVIVGCSFLAFCVVNLLPGDIVHSILGDNYTPESAALITKQLHLDQPFLLRYLDWLGGALSGRLGTSLTATHESVSSLIGRSFPPTLELLIGGQVFALLLSVLLAVASVAARSAMLDRAITAVAMFSLSMPPFVLGLLLLELLAVKFHVVSSVGWADPSMSGWGANIHAILLPSFLLGLSIFPGHMRVFRSELFEQLDQEDYVHLARMKGIGSRRLITHHLIRNSSFGLITLIGVSTAQLFAGAVITEQVFSIPGMGTLILNSVTSHDSPTVVASITLVAVLIVLFNLLVDLGYGMLDPRVRDAVSA